MITAKEYLNKIKWDSNCNPAEYTLYYLDRITKKLIPLRFEELVFPEQTDFYFMVWDGMKFITIPTHRLRKIYKGQELVWSRHD